MTLVEICPMCLSGENHGCYSDRSGEAFVVDATRTAQAKIPEGERCTFCGWRGTTTDHRGRVCCAECLTKLVAMHPHVAAWWKESGRK